MLIKSGITRLLLDGPVSGDGLLGELSPCRALVDESVESACIEPAAEDLTLLLRLKGQSQFIGGRLCVHKV